MQRARLQTWFWEPGDRLGLFPVPVLSDNANYLLVCRTGPGILSRPGPTVSVPRFYLEVRCSYHLLPGCWLSVAPGSAHSFQPEEQTHTRGQVSTSHVLQSSWMSCCRW